MNDSAQPTPAPAGNFVWHGPDGFTIDTDRERLNFEAIYEFVSQSYWASGVSRERLARAIAYSIPFGAYEGERLVGFARVVTDRASFGYLADVFVVPNDRGRGISKALMTAVQRHPELQDLRRWLLGTRDAHGLYAQFGFAPLASPSIFMEIWEPSVYERLAREGRA
ncbi:MAG TPA: GNAT family N-acetyltransferase [Polyangiaceae bacterium]|jgi:GNAT superfamily N-acetyltransferase